MKKITRFSVLVAAMVASMSMAYSQAKIDFETVGGGNAYFWAVFQNGAGATDNFDLLVAPIANPSATGINTSANCLKFIEDPTAAPWGGLFTDDIVGGITFTAQNCFVKVMVYKSVASNFGVKLEGDAGNKEILVPNTKINEWEELTFDFTSEIGKTYKRLVLLPDFPAARTAGSTIYIDNISFGTGTTPPPPPASTIAKIDFETVGGGNAFFWAVFQNGAGGTDNFDLLVAPIANPSATGINTSANCLKFIEDPTAAPWGGLFTDDIVGGITFTAQNCFVKVMVYKTATSPFGVKFEGDIPAIEKLVPNTKINEWEELTFNFSSEIGKTYKRLVLLPDFANPRVGGSTTYIDNISFGTGTVVPPTGPTVPASTPTLAAENVVSIFSDAYTNITSVKQDWYGNTFSDMTIVGNNTLKDVSICCFGYEFAAGLIPATMTILHVDIYPVGSTSFSLGVPQNGDKKKNFTLVENQWNSINLTLSDLGTIDNTLLTQVGFWDLGGTYYIDNVYFSKVATAIKTVDSKLISIYPNPATDNLMIKSDTEISQIVVSSLVGQNIKSFTINGLEKSIDLSSMSAGNYLVTVKLSSGLVSIHKFVKL